MGAFIAFIAVISTSFTRRLAGMAVFFALATGVAQGAERGLVLGVFPRLSASETTTRYTPMAEHLSERLGTRVSLVASKDFDAFWQGVEEQRFDIVLYNQFHYIRSSKTYQVIAHNKEFGKSTLAGALYVRKDSNITSIAQLRGRTVLFGGGEDAMIGYVAPMFLLLKAGLARNDITARFAVNPLNSVIGVARKQADAAGSGDAVVEQPALRNAINTDEVVVLAVTEQLLHLPWAVRRSMPSRQRETIQNALVDLENSDAGRKVLRSAVLSGIGRAEDKDYNPHRVMVRAVLGSAVLP
jgi:phosphonate transport system substrate-binding protein